MKERILLVDDEPSMLALYSLQLNDEYELSIATSGMLGVASIQESGPFAVIVSDLGMPNMNGAQFLARARTLAPDSVRMLLTGQTDLNSAVTAVNEGRIFCFLTKPCPRADLLTAIRSGVEQHHLLTAEKVLLEQTLRGSIEVLTEVLSLVSPAAFGKASRIRRLVQQLGEVLHVPNPWLLEIAGMLSQIGCIAVPEALLAKFHSGHAMTKEERTQFELHAKVGGDLICKIPRLESVAQMVFHQNRRYDSQIEESAGDDSLSLLGATILKVALDCEELESQGLHRGQALERLRERVGCYAPTVLRAMEQLPEDASRYASRVVSVAELRCQMILAEDLLNKSGVVLVRKGQQISAAMLTRLINHTMNGTLRDAIRVFIPAHLTEIHSNSVPTRVGTFTCKS